MIDWTKAKPGEDWHFKSAKGLEMFERSQVKEWQGVWTERPRGGEGVIMATVHDGEYTGGSVSYYSVHVTAPTTPDNPPYTAECNDIIEALGMNYAEGNAFKALWRRAAARRGLSKRGYKDGLYDAEKVEFFGRRLVEQEKARHAEEG